VSLAYFLDSGQGQAGLASSFTPLTQTTNEMLEPDQSKKRVQSTSSPLEPHKHLFWGWAVFQLDDKQQRFFWGVSEILTGYFAKHN
jgi:hypothetical protein